MTVYVTGEDKLRADLRGMARAALDLEPVLDRQARRTAEAIGGVPRGRSGRLGEGVKSPKNRKVTRSGFRDRRRHVLRAYGLWRDRPLGRPTADDP